MNTIAQLKLAVCSGNDELFEEVVSVIPPNVSIDDTMLLHYAISIPTRERFIEPLIQLGIPITQTILETSVRYNKCDVFALLYNASTVLTDTVLTDTVLTDTVLTDTLLKCVLTKGYTDMLNIVIPLYSINELNRAMVDKTYPIESLRKLLTVCDINYASRNGTVLYKYISNYKGDTALECVKMILDSPNVNVNIMGRNMSPFTLALENDNFEVVELLLQTNEVNICSTFIKYCKSNTMLDLLTHYGVITNDMLNDMLNICIVHGSLNVVVYLIEKGAEVTDKNLLELMRHDPKHTKGMDTVFETMLNLGVNVNYEHHNETPLIISFKNRRDMIYYINRLIEYGANPLHTNIYNETILHYALMSGNMKHIKYIIDNYSELLISSVYDPFTYASGDIRVMLVRAYISFISSMSQGLYIYDPLKLVGILVHINDINLLKTLLNVVMYE